MASIELNVQGMSCGACVKHVTQALTPLAGVEAVAVDLATGRVRVTGAAPGAALLAALDAAGYPAQLLAATAPTAGNTAGGGSGSSCCCH
ncbi:MAG: cation transporter [Pseudomonas sp.]|nr:cation transporter [Pseudomonas sp.]